VFKLFCVSSLCKNCGMCEALLHGFTAKGKCIYISKSNVCEEEIRAAADRVVQGCPNDAIKLVQSYR
jgi:ferredoxin